VVILNEIGLPKNITTLEPKWRCGYVGVHSQHQLYKKEYGEIDELVFAHGGLTFSGFGDGEYLPIKNIWYFGFDCNHFKDTINNWTFKRVKKEVIELAEQLTTKNLILKGLE